MATKDVSTLKEIKLIVGDSYSSLISSPTLLSTLGITSFGTNWEAELVIRETNIEGIVVLTKTLTKNIGNTKWLFDITPTESNALTSPLYFFAIEIKDLVDNNFRREILQAKLKMSPSAVLN